MKRKLASRLPGFVLDPLLRRKAKLHETPLDKYRVFIARDVKEYEDAFKLLHIAYVYQGIESVSGVDMRITPQHVLPESTVFVAYEGDTMVGTMTVTLDSPAGLPIETDYPEKVAEMRRRGARVVEYGSLAVVRYCWHTGVTTLLNAAAHWWSLNVLKATDGVIDVDPRAIPWYRAVLNFKPMGEPKHRAEPGAIVLPLVGMSNKLRESEEFVVRHFKKPMANGVPAGEAMRSLRIPCIDIPREISDEELVRWKLPREVFQEIFIKKSNRLDSLDPKTREYLKKLRTVETLETAHDGPTSS